MTNTTQIDNYYKNIKKKQSLKTFLTKFEGYTIAVRHHPKPIIDDIYGENQTKQFTSIQVIGTPGTGKTTLVNFLAHEIHTKDSSYLVYHFGKNELLRFDDVLDSLPNQNLILIFDDVSLVFKLIKDQDRKTKILQTLTEARHPKFESTDRKVIVIVISHYENSIEKMWRSQSGWKIYTDLNSEEKGNLNARTKGAYKNYFNDFVKITLEQFRSNDKKYHIRINENRTEEYDPFKLRFAMVYDGLKPRFMLVPPRACGLCSKSRHMLKKVEATPDEIIDLMLKYYGKYGPAGMKLALLQAGETAQFQNKMMYAYFLAKELLSFFDIDKAQLAQRMRERAKIKGTRLYNTRHKKINFLADLDAIRHGKEINTISDEMEPENSISTEITQNTDEQQEEASTITDES
jgi:hypothetical protein